MWPRAIAATFFCAYRGFPRVEVRWRFRLCVLRRQNPLEGYRRLTYMMINANMVACSPASTYRVLKAAGMLAGSTPVPSKKGTGVVQPLVPHEHWYVDISYINVAGNFLFLRGVLDGCSRYITHWQIREKMEETDVKTILLKAREAHSGTRRCFSADEHEHVFQCFKCGRPGNALDLWSMAEKQPPYEAAVDLCGRLNVPIPYLPVPDSNGDRGEAPIPGLATSPIHCPPLPRLPIPLPTNSIVAFFLITSHQHTRGLGLSVARESFVIPRRRRSDAGIDRLTGRTCHGALSGRRRRRSRSAVRLGDRCPVPPVGRVGQLRGHDGIHPVR